MVHERKSWSTDDRGYDGGAVDTDGEARVQVATEHHHLNIIIPTSSFSLSLLNTGETRTPARPG